MGADKPPEGVTLNERKAARFGGTAQAIGSFTAHSPLTLKTRVARISSADRDRVLMELQSLQH